jgi:F-box protein 9
LKEKEETVAKQFEQLELEEENEIKLDPCWLLDVLSDDILIEIITILTHTDPRAHVALSSTCQRLSGLCFDPIVYKHLCKLVYPPQVYSLAAIQLNNISRDQEEMVKSWDYNWKDMLNDRPYIKFHGVYISKVSYISEGVREYSYYAPVKVVTYFRYLRFYPDGTAFKVTTTDEPSEVVPHFHRENHSSIKMSLLTNWHIEMDGQVYITRKSADYEFIEELRVGHLGDRKYHRLNWVSSGSINKDGERSNFNMRKEKPFNFSAVKSYKVDYGRTL